MLLVIIVCLKMDSTLCLDRDIQALEYSTRVVI